MILNCSTLPIIYIIIASHFATFNDIAQHYNTLDLFLYNHSLEITLS